MKTSIIKSSLLTIISIIFLLLVWKVTALFVNSEIIIPSPETTLQSLISIINDGNFLTIVISTVLRMLIALIISCIAGVTAGLIIGFSKIIDSLFKPFLVVVMSTPVVSFILLAMIWLKTENIPIFVTFLMVFPIITVNVGEGIKNIDKKLVQMAKAYKVNKWRIMSEIYLPSIMSYLIAAISTAVGIGWKVVVTAEVLSQPQFAIGTSLETSKAYLETSTVFAWTIIALLLSLLFEKTIRLAEAKVFKWR